MKNEAPFILEWVAHQKVIGFDDIVVYTNDCTDGTDEILMRLDALGYLRFHRNHVGRGGVQRSALRQARRLDVIKDSDWIFVTDADEFLNIHVGDNRVDDLIAASGPDADVISVAWRMFSSAQRPIMRDKPVTAHFTDAELPYEDGGAGRRFFKSLMRNKEGFLRFGIHGPRPLPENEEQFVWTAPGGHHKRRRPFGTHLPPPFGQEIAQINHYAVRSAQSYLVKKSRGRANHATHNLDTAYWQRWNRGGAADTTISRYAGELQKWLDEFKSDRRLAQLHGAGFRWHKAKINELLEQEDYATLYRKIARSKPVICPRVDRRVIPFEPLETAKARPEKSETVK
ncbi:MAG: glycosyltransferase family 2 protein [Alphaproteobacteria bacterium]|nr:glycosyltransferase family 2 protein [Alphaproteobacteria bacterium]